MSEKSSIKSIIKLAIINVSIAILFIFILAICFDSTEAKCVIHGDWPMFIFTIGILTTIVGVGNLFILSYESCAVTCFIGISMITFYVTYGNTGLLAVLSFICVLFCILQIITKIFCRQVVMSVIFIGLFCFIFHKFTPPIGDIEELNRQVLYENCQDAEWGYYLTTDEDSRYNKFIVYTGLYNNAIKDSEKQKKYYSDLWSKEFNRKIYVEIEKLDIHMVPREIAIKCGDIEMAKRIEERDKMNKD